MKMSSYLWTLKELKETIVVSLELINLIITDKLQS